MQLPSTCFSKSCFSKTILNPLVTTRLQPGVRARGYDKKTMQILKDWLYWGLHSAFDWVPREG